ncbi:hypothetical protein [endosymbiont 'TC1' of Trimyema compressum]|uniref:hypothetical protein n=1 Tax=endosymbiont 'TC1' of Trimyema compressum TaxID=243899 RepID=UPI001392335D|nr:hypothetical protein [endosymbiont 'TC1' of Trimyema compressum]
MRVLVGAFSVILAFVAMIQSCASGVMTVVDLSNFGSAMAIMILCILFVIAGILALAGNSSRVALTFAAIFYTIAGVVVLIAGNWIWAIISFVFAIIMIYYVAKPINN